MNMCVCGLEITFTIEMLFIFGKERNNQLIFYKFVFS